MVDTKPGCNSTYYVNHWNNIYGSGSQGEVQEWHISYKDVKLALDPYVKASCRLVNDVPLEIIDIGCGKSNIGSRHFARLSHDKADFDRLLVRSRERPQSTFCK